MKITIGKSILSQLPDFNIVALTMDVDAKLTDDKIENLIKETEEKIYEEYSLEEVLNIPLIKEGRDGYKKLKKDPSRYRLACESLLRRLVKGNKLYRINNLVDVGNILSIEAKRSVAVLDCDKIVGDVYIRLGTNNDVYEGIGRGIINVENIPLYEDNISPFGSTTSDTLRTSVTLETKKILLFVVCFSEMNLDEHKALAIDLFKEYCSARNIEEIKVEKEI